MPLVAFENVSISYDGVYAVHDVNFTVEAGDYLCIVGENGAGKSTVIKGLLSLVPLKSGNIRLIPPMTRRDIGYLPQYKNVRNDFPASVYEVVLSGRLSKRGIFPFYRKKDKQAAMESMRQLNILDLKDKPYCDLSGGQQQRTLLARAICSAGKLLVLDEPVAGLDPKVTQEMYDIVKRLNQQQGVAVVMVSHDIHAAVLYANKILHMDQTVQFFGSRDDYVNSAPGRAFLKGE